ncbi:MAG: hypothetical protein HY238_22925 [Acidobacteria bacterium]|nr:hypothetical protein [Acidobacteriota bacterium]
MTRRELLAGAAATAVLRAAEPDWPKTAAEAVGYLRDYIRIDTSNPPGNVTGAAAFLGKVLAKEGIATERLDPGPAGKANLLARLPGSARKRPLLLLSHMDTVPADPAAGRPILSAARSA